MPSLSAIFHLIERTTAEVFGDDAPALVCEPGRGLVADAVALLAQVKAVRDGHACLPQRRDLRRDGGTAADGRAGPDPRLCPRRHPRTGEAQRRIVFGPTCDSVDRLPGEIALPDDLAEGDYLLVQGMGAYSVPTNTRFNGFGALALEMALTLEP
jgi:ornithine decarboxylase